MTMNKEIRSGQQQGFQIRSQLRVALQAIEDNWRPLDQSLHQWTVGQGEGEIVLAGEVDLLQGFQRIPGVDLIGDRKVSSRV